MNHQINADHSCPMAFVVVPTFVGALVWLCAILVWIQ
jgi:hypothetical protein